MHEALTPIGSGQSECTVTSYKGSGSIQKLGKSELSQVELKNLNETCEHGYARGLIAETEATKAAKVGEE